ncbi:hypothetical protein [Lentzea flaviverrucosa]|uniref:Uncharacterized protein n=1 Tax=Lentzea flaviverrucosa TaxID=200379 RepID=A0A1H9SPQ6_9PSEU|nr:hypothetical protein [Lentzea flaviverrucosa]RDI25461.1 hypothetical protein DFR72_108159 [Lentzea flaviverrucosa]SER86864.1 hypothetical protein SAMN05216195_107160 [Lentzea flaviverrucosa]
MLRNLVRELKTLRKGRGVHAGRIVDKIGPSLAAACGITSADGSVAAKQKLVTRLTELIEQLPDDLQLAARAAFGLIADVRQPLYQERVTWVAARIDRDSRTVRRRVDEAVEQLAELAATTSPRADGGWHTSELSVAVVLDQGQPEVLERYQVVVDQDGVESLDFASVFPVRRRDVDVHLLYGGTLRERGDGGRPGFTLVPAEPLVRGEIHDFAIRYRMSHRDAMHPCVLHVPERPCDLFDLRVRFEHDRKRLVRAFDGVLVQRSDAEPAGSQRTVDRAGEIHLRFRRLLPGLLYGARWGSAAVCSARRAS